MTARERVLRSLAHESPDKVPVDFGSTAVTGIHVACVGALRDRFGLEKRPVKAFEPYQMLGWIDDDLLDAMGIGTAGVFPRGTLFGFANENWREFRAPWGQVLLVSEHFRTTPAADGGLLLHPQGDLEAPPSGHMPANGFYFDTIVRQEEIDEESLDPADNLEEFGPISDADLRHFTGEVDRLTASPRGAGRAIVACFGGTAFGDIALVPAPFLKRPKGIRDVAEWYVSTVMRQDYLHAVFSRQCEIALANLGKIHAAVGDAVHVVFLCGTDFGAQISTFCSPQTFDDLYAPYYRQVNDWIHRNTGWQTFKHSCGAVETLMSRFIDVGFDILNPVQCSAEGMDPGRLKERHGDRLTFWGGGVDTQKTLPFGTPEQVRAEVLSRCEQFAPGGGFVFNSIHNVQPNTPIENTMAMLEAVREFNGEL